jgi:hypothetical protein
MYVSRSDHTHLTSNSSEETDDAHQHSLFGNSKVSLGVTHYFVSREIVSWENKAIDNDVED